MCRSLAVVSTWVPYRFGKIFGCMGFRLKDVQVTTLTLPRDDTLGVGCRELSQVIPQWCTGSLR